MRGDSQREWLRAGALLPGDFALEIHGCQGILLPFVRYDLLKCFDFRTIVANFLGLLIWEAGEMTRVRFQAGTDSLPHSNISLLLCRVDWACTHSAGTAALNRSVRCFAEHACSSHWSLMFSAIDLNLQFHWPRNNSRLRVRCYCDNGLPRNSCLRFQLT